MAEKSETVLPQLRELALDALKRTLSHVRTKRPNHDLEVMLTTCKQLTGSYTGTKPLSDLRDRYGEVASRHTDRFQDHWHQALEEAAAAAAHRYLRQAERETGDAAGPLLRKAVNGNIAAAAAVKRWNHATEDDISRSIEMLAAGTLKPRTGRSLLEAAVRFRDKPTPPGARILLDLVEQAARNWPEDDPPGASGAIGTS